MQQTRLTLHVLLLSTGCCVWSSCVTFGSFSPGKASFSSGRREMPSANQLSGFFPGLKPEWKGAFRPNLLPFFASIDCFDMFKSYSISNWQVRLLHIGFVSRKGIKSELSMGSLWLCTAPGSFQRAFSLSLKRWANIKPSKRSRSMVVQHMFINTYMACMWVQVLF